MLDINFIKENLEKVKKSIDDRKLTVDLDKLLKVHEKRKVLVNKIIELRVKRNEASEKRDVDSGKKIKLELDSLESEFRPVDREWIELMNQVPNVPLDDVPQGDASHFEIIHKEGDQTKLNFIPKDHVELGELLDIIDIPRAAKVSGARFAYLKGKGVLLEFALVQYAMERLIKEGFIPVLPPAIIKMKMAHGLGYWNGGGHVNYYHFNDPKEQGEQEEKDQNLYLIGTGEHAIVPMHQDEIFLEDELPKKYAAFSSCFRREVGTGGQDIRGILRVHQFDKVEMVNFVKPENDEIERKKMLSIAEDLMKGLGLPYQVKKLPSGDISFPAAETIDIETWIPSQNLYRETHSISTTTDFQSRRLKIRFKRGNSNEFVHILNGTALAIGRVIIALLENFQTEDGSVIIPEVLQKHTGFLEIRPK